MATQEIVIAEAADFVHARSGAPAQNFDGVAPAETPVQSDRGFTWTNPVHAGLIDPEALGIKGGVRVWRIALFMANQDDWKIELVDGASSHTVADGTIEPGYNAEGLATLTAGQKLKVTTTGAGTTAVKMVCTLSRLRIGDLDPAGI